MKQSLKPQQVQQFNNSIDSVQLDLRKNFVRTLIYPDEYSQRMPDEVTQQTNLYRSLREFALIANMDGTANAGRFSFAVKPILGSQRNLTDFQVGIVDNSNGWPDSYATKTAYVKQNLYSDPRIDPMAIPLLTNPSFSYTLTEEVGPTLSQAAIDGTIQGYWWQTQENNPFFFEIKQAFNVKQKFNSNPFPTLGPINIPGGDSSGINLGAMEGMTFFILPSGQYMITPSFRFLSGVPIGSVTNSLQMFVISIDMTTSTVDGAIKFQYNSQPVISGFFAATGNLDLVNNYNAEWASNTQTLFAQLSMALSLDGNHGIAFGLYTNSGLVFPNGASGLVINSTTDLTLNIPSNSGSLIKYRPIACSCLVTCTLPDLTAGGNIVGYSAPAGDIDNYYYKTSGVIGPYQEWQNLARNNKGLNTHDGNFKDGVYVWTQPWDINDTLMRVPSDTLAYPYQGIIVSGQVNPTVNLSGVIEIGRIRICIIYEYTTDNRLFLGESCFGSTADLDWCLAFLASQQHACENKMHPKVLKNIITKAAQWVTKAAPVVQRGLSMASGIAKLML